jgi:hypothetical protein
MMRSDTVAAAINDHVLASDCVRHARMFFGSRTWGWILQLRAHFTLGPTGDMLADLRRDYERMAGMIIGAAPESDEVIQSVREAERRVNDGPDGIA